MPPHFPNSYIRLTDYGFSPGNTAAANNAAWTAAVAAAPAKGAILEIPAADLPYQISATLAPTKLVYIRGVHGGPSNAGAHQTPVLQWTGGASPVVSFSGTGCTGSTLEGVGIDNAGTATVGVDIDGAQQITVRGVSLDHPTTPFSAAGIRVGNTAGCTLVCLDAVTVKAAAPIGLLLASVTAHFVAFCCCILENTTCNVRLGTATTAALSCHFLECTFEMSLAALNAVEVVRAQQCDFDGCYFETTGAGRALKIASDAVVAAAIGMRACWFTGLASAASAVETAFASTILSLIGNYYTGYSASLVKNTACQRLFLASNQGEGSDPLTVVDSLTRVTALGNGITGNNGSEPGQADGGFVVGAAALAANATKGFFYLPSCPGAPAGVPVSYTGRIPLVYDSTNSRLNAYDGTAWRSLRRVFAPVTLTDAATIATDASLIDPMSGRFRVSLAVNRTLGAPTSPVDGQAAEWEVKNTDSAAHDLTLASGAGGYVLCDQLTALPSIPAGKTLTFGARYRSGANRWVVTGAVTDGA